MLTWYNVFFNKNMREKSSCNFPLLKIECHVSIERPHKNFRMSSSISLLILVKDSKMLTKIILKFEAPSKYVPTKMAELIT
jgi:hypothetical protein